VLNFFVVSFFTIINAICTCEGELSLLRSTLFSLISTIVLRNSMSRFAIIRRGIFVMTSHSFNAQRKWPAIVQVIAIFLHRLPGICVI